eukprot:CAMPEP_0185751112 /NCGR_PEP_ID=MMETSP1174-20130828/9864_1 /TAXON_ID=35687 /ORGANISM="Dictyocha speculum, Strain CCMP1381" /LENGTH=124 /DNA_ID=CAMNT_0028427935 /DNA_START=21 /DNA_END=395 /DNA_ORIENTATION=+
MTIFTYSMNPEMKKTLFFLQCVFAIGGCYMFSMGANSAAANEAITLDDDGFAKAKDAYGWAAFFALTGGIIFWILAVLTCVMMTPKGSVCMTNLLYTFTCDKSLNHKSEENDVEEASVKSPINE